MRLLSLAACFIAPLALGAPPVIPVLVSDGPRAEGIQRLALDGEKYEALRGLGEFRLADIPLAAGQPFTFNLERIEVFTPDAIIVAASEEGEVPLPRPDLQTFVGTVEGIPHSTVFLALSPGGTNGYIQLPEGLTVISSGPAGSLPTVIYNTFGPDRVDVNVQMPACAGAILPDDVALPPVNTGAGYGDRAGVCRAYRLAVDCDTEFTAQPFGGSQTLATIYVSTLVGSMTGIYRNEINAGFQLAYLRLWTGTDPYTQSSSGNQLTQFRSYWNSNMGSVQRDLAHLMSVRPLGGGVAYLGSTCNSNAYGLSGNMSGSFPHPVRHNSADNWDIMVVTHEIGHNVGSGHTHDPNSYNPPIDGCGNAYLTPAQTQDCTAADLNIGTIMSYCHLCSGGMTNMRMEFGPRPSTVIRNYVDTHLSCGIAPTVTITQNPTSRTVCQGDPVTFTVNATGTGTRTYQWRRNGNVVNGTEASYTITASPTNAGTYDCVVTATCTSATSTTALLTVNTCPCDPDVNQDGSVDQDDVTYLITVIGGGGNPSGIDPDFNQDGNVDQDDISALINTVGGGGCP